MQVNGKEIILVGAAHVSEKSVKQVRETIEKEKPDVVGVELDRQRYDALTKQRSWQGMRIGRVLEEGKIFLLFLNIMLANFQRKVGEDLGVKPGSEMLEAIKAAREVGAKVVLLDRDVRITLRRAWECMSPWEKFKFMGLVLNDLFFGEEIDKKTVEKMKKKSVLTELIEELSKELPNAKRVLVDERDAYIANKIRESKAKKMVVVVGAGHVNGIKKYLRTPVRLAAYKPKKPLLKARHLAYLIPLIFFAIIAYGFYTGGPELTMDLLLKWFLINGTLSALGALLAFGHPLTILSAFLAAPFTSLNPVIGAGYVAGIVETKVRNPTVKDIENLRDLNSLGDYWRNGVTRILLVVFMANIGSMIGTFIALPYLGALVM
jgi:pheromone shutdown-related protein TraB